ncbi:MAG: hypothetical protein WA901_10345, partial [Phormidesmis sp.]
MRFSPLFLLPLVTLFAIGSAAQAQTISTPLSEPLEVTGQTGGSDSSACGNISRSDGQTIRLIEPCASLSFEVESEGDYTLLITGPNGFRECV